MDFFTDFNRPKTTNQNAGTLVVERIFIRAYVHIVSGHSELKMGKYFIPRKCCGHERTLSKSEAIQITTSHPGYFYSTLGVVLTYFRSIAQIFGNNLREGRGRRYNIPACLCCNKKVLVSLQENRTIQ